MVEQSNDNVGNFYIFPYSEFLTFHLKHHFWNTALTGWHQVFVIKH